MKPNLKKEFNKIQKDNPCWSSLVCFTIAVLRNEYSHGTILRNFKELVDEEDYDKHDTEEIVLDLEKRTGSGFDYEICQNEG